MNDYKMFLQALGFLIVIILLAYLALRYGLQSVYRGFGGGRLEVLEKIVLDPKSGSHLFLVRLGREIYLLGASSGSIRILKTIDQEEFASLAPPSVVKNINLKDSFGRLLRNVKKGPPAEKPGDEKRP